MTGHEASRLTWPLVDGQTMRALDRHTIEGLGVSGELLMESAGRVSAEIVVEHLGSQTPGAEVLVVCGAGSNGGDGFVVARHLAQAGVAVRVCLAKAPTSLAGEAAKNLDRVRALRIPVEGLPVRLPKAGVVVDALLGTGLSRPLEGEMAALVKQINSARSERLLVVAIDIPTGLDADTGAILGAAVECDITVAISLPKIGLALEPGRSLAGEVRVARVGIADAAPGVELDVELWSAAAVAGALPSRPVDGHKGSFGHVLLVAGSEGKTGAAALAAAGAVRTGAGLVTVACPESLNGILEVKCTEAMTAPLPETAVHALGKEAQAKIVELAGERDVVAIGPGLGRAEATQNLVRSLVTVLNCPAVIDADALFALGSNLHTLKTRRSPTILTPHPGEAARLLGTTAAEINARRVESARQLARDSGCVVVLKGAPTVTADASGRVVVNSTGGPALATGGTGDVLTGMIAALLGQGVGALEASASAVYLHGRSADILVEERDSMGMLASDLAEGMPAAVADVLQHARKGPSAGVLGGGLALPFPGR
jgi:hydroxyethylthiazole kinase-like uncharacterized protein yjeF